MNNFQAKVKAFLAGLLTLIEGLVFSDYIRGFFSFGVALFALLFGGYILYACFFGFLLPAVVHLPYLAADTLGLVPDFASGNTYEDISPFYRTGTRRIWAPWEVWADYILVDGVILFALLYLSWIFTGLPRIFSFTLRVIAPFGIVYGFLFMNKSQSINVFGEAYTVQNMGLTPEQMWTTGIIIIISSAFLGLFSELVSAVGRISRKAPENPEKTAP